MPGTDHRGELPAECSDARVRISEAIPVFQHARVQAPLLPISARDHDRQAVGCHLQHRDAGLVGPKAVALRDRALPASARFRVAPCTCRFIASRCNVRAVLPRRACAYFRATFPASS